MPTQNGFFAGGNGTTDPTGSTCAYYVGNPGGFTPGLWDPNCTSDSAHIGGIPNGFQGGPANAGCPAPTAQTGAGAAGGCTLNAAVAERRRCRCRCSTSRSRGSSTRSERFGMLGCDPTPTAAVHEPGRRRRRPDRHGERCPTGRRRARPCSARRTATRRSSSATPRRARRC